MPDTVEEWYEVQCAGCRRYFEWHGSLPPEQPRCDYCQEQFDKWAAQKAKREAKLAAMTPEQRERENLRVKLRRESAKRYRQRLDDESRERYYGPFLRDTEVGRALAAHAARVPPPRMVWVRIVNACKNAGIETAADVMQGDVYKWPNIGKISLRYLYDALGLAHPIQIVLSLRRKMEADDLGPADQVNMLLSPSPSSTP